MGRYILRGGEFFRFSRSCGAPSGRQRAGDSIKKSIQPPGRCRSVGMPKSPSKTKKLITQYIGLLLLSAVRASFLIYSTPLCAGIDIPIEKEALTAIQLFERGRSQFSEGLYRQAAKSFQKISSQEKLFPLAQIWLARLALRESGPKRAENSDEITAKLDLAEKLLAEKNPLQLEIAYLRGEHQRLLGNYTKAIYFFEKALPKQNIDKAAWYAETLNRLGWCYLRSAEHAENILERAKRAEEVFTLLRTVRPGEESLLGLAQCYLTQGDVQSLQRAEALLTSEQEVFSVVGQAQALLLRAQAASTYLERARLWREFLSEGEQKVYDKENYGMGWYLSALNDLRQAGQLQKEGELIEAQQLYICGAFALRRAEQLLTDPSLQTQARHWRAWASYCQGTQVGRQQALELLIDEKNHNRSDREDETLYLLGTLSAHSQADKNKSENVLDDPLQILAEQALSELIAKHKESKYGISAYYTLAALKYKQGKKKAAKELFFALAERWPQDEYAGDALLWSLRCSEELGESAEDITAVRQQIISQYPETNAAAEASFHMYNAQEYLQGDRAAIKHLEAFIKHFPNSPLVMNALYLTAWDHKRDRKNKDERWLRRKNWIAVIDALQQLETVFERQYHLGLISQEKILEYISLYWRARVDRAIANFAIALESTGTKRTIYLEYAEELLQHIQAEFSDTNQPLVSPLTMRQYWVPLREENSFYLAKTFIEKGNDAAAEALLLSLVEKCRSAKIFRGKLLSRIFLELATIAINKHNEEIALAMLEQAEKAGKGGILTTDQKLELWLERSACLRRQKNSEQAMLWLSRVINDDSVSSLRLKAMFLRAELYEEQGRHELAGKQLQALAELEGEWGASAQEKLDRDYAF